MACTMVAGFSGNSFAALLGSARPAAQENFQQLIQTNECPSCDLAGVVLTRVNLSGANLEGANLAGAKLLLANLSEANLRNANLQGAALGGADLAGADLRGANLTGAVLEGAYLKGALIDGRIISDKPYEAEDLPEVTEKKHVADESSSKNVPYTQEVVIDDRRDLSDSPLAAPSEVQLQQNKTVAAADAAAVEPEPPSKTLVPMADAVVHAPASETTAASGEIGEQVEPPVETVSEAEEDGGLWGSVTSFFGAGSSDGNDQPEAASAAMPETEEQGDTPVAEKAVVQEAQPEPEPEPVAVESRAGEVDAAAPAVETAEGTATDDTGFWGSVTSIFSSDSDKKVEEVSTERAVEQVPAPADEVIADAASEPGAELASDSEVMNMIEQIEGPAPEPVPAAAADTTVSEVAVAGGEEAAVQGEEMVVEPAADNASVEAEASAAGDSSEKAVAAGAESGRQDADTVEPAAGSTVSDMISQIEADQELEPVPADTVVYGVETPEQARAKQQMYIDRLLDDDRCVACDLAGVDLAGKNLGGVDLERANLQGANLEGVDLGEANLKGVNFSGANLKDADLREADLYRADFTGADLTGARFEAALIDSAVFTDAAGANLEGAIKDE